MNALSAILPVFLIIGLGAALQRGGFFPTGSVRQLNHLTYWVGMPALIFSKIATASHDLGPTLRVLLPLLLSTLTTMALAWLGTRIWLLPRGRRGALIQAAYRGNLAFVGMPVLILAFHSPGQPPGPIETAAVLLLGPMIPFYNLSAVWILLADQPSDGNPVRWTRLITEALVNPLLLSALLGIIWHTIQLPHPHFFFTTLETVGAIGLPLALIAIGATIVRVNLREAGPPSLLAAVLKTIITPCLGVLWGSWVGLEGHEWTLLLVFLACPTAAASYVMCVQMRNDEHLAASAVALSTLLSLVSLAVILMFSGV